MSQKLLQRFKQNTINSMKNLFLTLAFMLIGSFAFANNSTPPKSDDGKTLSNNNILNCSQNSEKKNDESGRQCCTKTRSMSDGSSISVTACAGWFLSDDASAMTRACAKVFNSMNL
jgi:hypothetical protein